MVIVFSGGSNVSMVSETSNPAALDSVVELLRSTYRIFLSRESPLIKERIEGISCSDEKVYIYIPIYGSIEVPHSAIEMLSLPAIERLQLVFQLATTHFMYVGATHTRLEHSIGVAFLTNKMLQLLENELKNLGVSIIHKDNELAFLAGLLHDIGHPTWGHVLDSISGFIVRYLSPPVTLASNRIDKVLLSTILLNDTQIRYKLNIIGEKCWNSYRDIDLKKCSLSDLIFFILSQELHPHDKKCEDIVKERLTYRILKLISRIIEAEDIIGGIDTDRIDYLVRDIHHTHMIESPSTPYEKKLMYREIYNFVTSPQGKFLPFNIRVNIRADGYIPNIDGKIFGMTFDKFLSQLRDYLYENLYECKARAFADSLLARLAYATLLSILKYMSVRDPSHIREATLGYLLLNQTHFIDVSIQFLEAFHKFVGNDPEYKKKLNVSETELMFIAHTLRLRSYFHGLRYLIYMLSSKLNTLEPIELEPNVHIAIIPLEKIFEYTSKVGAEPDLSYIYALRRFADSLYSDAFNTMNIIEIEFKLNNELIRREIPSNTYIQDVAMILLPVSYSSKYIKKFVEKLLKSKEGHNESERYLDYPIAFIILKTDKALLDKGHAKALLLKASMYIAEDIWNIILKTSLQTS